MSPIGRVFILLNLALAGGFVVLSGTYLQKQDTYKKQFDSEKELRAKESNEAKATIAGLQQDLNKQVAETKKKEGELGESTNSLARALDENKALNTRLTSMEADVKNLTATAGQSRVDTKNAIEQMNKAFETAKADLAKKDEAIREKDKAVAENADLKSQVAKLSDTVTAREASIKGLEGEKANLNLLVKVAESYGFIKSMAAPNLTGLVTNASGRLCTIQVTDNPGKINIKEAIELGKWSFAIYDASGYKGEAIVERFEESANAVFCRVMNVKGEIKEGDKAATKTP